MFCLGVEWGAQSAFGADPIGVYGIDLVFLPVLYFLMGLLGF